MPTAIETSEDPITPLSDDVMMGHCALVEIDFRAKTIAAMDKEEMTSIDTLMHISKETLNGLWEDSVINRVNVDAIVRFQSWIESHIKQGNEDIENIDTLRAVFDRKVFKKHCIESDDNSSTKSFPDELKLSAIQNTSNETHNTCLLYTSDAADD